MATRDATATYNTGRARLQARITGAHPTHALGFILDRPATVVDASSYRASSRSISGWTSEPSQHTSAMTTSMRRPMDRIPPVPEAPVTEARARPATRAGSPEVYAQRRLARKCSVADCTNYTINKGLCFRHGGGKKCASKGCNSSAKIAGLCWKHGGSIQCIIDGCERRGKSRGLCWAHGGGTRCQAATCEKVAVSNGFCWAHGGGKRCHFNGCQRPAYERTLNFCPRHFKKFENGEEVLEL